MKKIDSTKDLPKWFCLDNYDAVAGFTARDWMRELLLRREAMDHLPYLAQASAEQLESIDLRDNVGSLSAFLNQLRQTPIGLVIPGNYYCRGASLRMEKNYLNVSKAIKPLTFEYLAWQRKSDMLAVQMGYPPAWDEIEVSLSVINRCWDDLCKPENAPASEDLDIPLKLSNHHLSRWPHPALVINLNAPDSILIGSFKQWLKESRSDDPLERPIGRKPLYERWGRYGLLPYLDLRIWEHESNTEIPDRVISAALSPGSHDRGEDSIRKTLAPIANKLSWHLHELEMYVAAESLSPEDFNG